MMESILSTVTLAGSYAKATQIAQESDRRHKDQPPKPNQAREPHIRRPSGSVKKTSEENKEKNNGQ